jgi:hypothetical protein
VRAPTAFSSLPPPSSTARVAATALCWIRCASVGPSSEILCVGYADGSVRAYAPSDDGQILFSERYHDKSSVVKIKLQATSVFKHTATASSSSSYDSPSFSELWMLHKDGTLVVLHLSQLRRAMQSAFNGSKPAEGCAHLKWLLQRQFEFVDFAAASPARSDLFQPKARTAGANVLICGMQPFCSVFRADGDKSEAPVTLQDAVSELVGWAGGAVLSSAAAFAPSWLSGITGGGGGGRSSSSRSSHNHNNGGVGEDDGSVWNDLASQKSSCSLKRHRPLRDDPRRVLSCTLAPPITGIPRVAALSDNLGRVLLIDVDDATVLRIFKGYRDAQCGWVTLNRHGVAGCYLVIYAPNRERIKVWRAVQGPLICSIKVPDAKSFAGARLHTTVSWNREDAMHPVARCFLIGADASSDKPTRSSPTPHCALHEVELPELHVRRVLEEHYLVAENQEDGYVLADFVDALRHGVAATRRGSTDGDRGGHGSGSVGVSDKDRGGEQGNQRGAAAFLLALLDMIGTPEVLVTAAEAINELLAGQGSSEMEGNLGSSLTLMDVLLSRIFSRLYAAVRENHASAKDTATTVSERVRRLRASLHVIGTQTALFSAYWELVLLSGQGQGDTRSIFSVSDGESGDAGSDDDLVVASGDIAEEEGGAPSLVASHLKTWMKLHQDFEVSVDLDETSSGAGLRVTPSFFCRCMQASFRVLELANSALTSATPNHERYVTEIDTLQLSSFGMRPHRQSLLSRFIFQPLLQHVFSMGRGSNDDATGHGFRRVQALLLEKMSTEDVMGLFATFWFDQATTSSMLGPKALARSGSVAGPATSSAAARWLFECTLRKEFYDPSGGNPADGTSAFDVLMQSCIQSTHLPKALLLARMCSQAWAQPILQSDIVNASSLPLSSQFAGFGDSPGEEHSDETEEDEDDEDEWTTPPPSVVSDGGGGSVDNVGDDKSEKERTPGTITKRRRQEYEAWAQLVRRLELALFLNCALNRRADGNERTPLTLEALMSGDPASSAARLVAELQLACGHDTEDTTAIKSACARMVQARSRPRDMRAIQVVAKAAVTNITDLDSYGIDAAVAEGSYPIDHGEGLFVEKIRCGELLRLELQWQDCGRGGGRGGGTFETESKQVGKDHGPGGGRVVDDVAWKWFGEEDGPSSGGAGGYAPSSLVTLLFGMMNEARAEKVKDGSFAALDTVACVFPHVAYDFDCVAAHRSLLLVERCSVGAFAGAIDAANLRTKSDHMRDVQHAIASVSHARMISDCDERRRSGEGVGGGGGDGCLPGDPSFSLRTLVLLHIWTKVLSPLCILVSSMWAQTELEAVSRFSKIAADDESSSPPLKSSGNDNMVEVAWRKEMAFRMRRLHGKFLATAALVLKLCLRSAEKIGGNDAGADATKAQAQAAHTEDEMRGSWPLVENPLRAHMVKTFANARLSSTAVRAHLQAVYALSAIVRHSVWGWDVKRLFVSGMDLFEVGSLFDAVSTAVVVTAAEVGPSSSSSSSSSSFSEEVAPSLSLVAARLRLVAEVTVKSSPDDAMALSADLSCDHNAALTECMRMLLLTGRESTAVDLLTKMEDSLQEQIAGMLVAVVCEQVVIVLSAMRKDRRYRSLLSTVPADLFKSVKTSAKAARVARAALHISDPAGLTRVSPSLSANHSLLGSLAPVLPRGSPELQTCIEVAGVVGTLFKGAKAIQAKGKAGQAGRRQ